MTNKELIQQEVDEWYINAFNLRDKMVLKDWKYFFLRDLVILKRHYEELKFVVDGDAKELVAEID